MRVLIFASLMGLFVASSAFAQQDTSTNPLKANMKQIGTLVKAMAGSVNDASKNADNAAAADQVVGLFNTCLTEVPDVVSTMPQDQQAAALSGFQTLIQKEIDLATQLGNDFKNNDNAGAASILSQMQDTKKDGHSQFNP